MEDTTQMDRTHNLERLPPWKLHLWRQISLDSRSRSAFPVEDFEGEYLKPYLRPYQHMFRWLLRAEDPFKYETLIPMWEHVSNGEWKLLLIEREDWVSVQAWGVDKAVCSKQVKVRRPRTGGLFVQGVKPINAIGEDWDVVSAKGVPSMEELGKNIMGARKAWWQLW